jgi:hypothetical protein
MDESEKSNDAKKEKPIDGDLVRRIVLDKEVGICQIQSDNEAALRKAKRSGISLLRQQKHKIGELYGEDHEWYKKCQEWVDNDKTRPFGKAAKMALVNGERERRNQSTTASAAKKTLVNGERERRNPSTATGEDDDDENNNNHRRGRGRGGAEPPILDHLSFSSLVSIGVRGLLAVTLMGQAVHPLASLIGRLRVLAALMLMGWLSAALLAQEANQRAAAAEADLEVARQEKNELEASLRDVQLDLEDANELTIQQTLATDIWQGRFDEVFELVRAAGADVNRLLEIRNRPLSSGS